MDSHAASALGRVTRRQELDSRARLLRARLLRAAVGFAPAPPCELRLLAETGMIG
jgi:hypothetical protein